jgi:N utilization substance protein B
MNNLKISNKDKIDALIAPLLVGWKMERIAKVDHALIQLGVVEMFFLEQKTPKAVVCNEYVDLSKKYGHKESPAFVNGVLEKIHFKDA